ncbi:MAG: hypothetical protein HYY04_18630 [Chloroflexi bacterium]|nr:hypothetical protein [Chloroflexota bacterium]
MAIRIQSTIEPARVVLAGVPRAGFYRPGDRCPEDFPFPSTLRVCLEHLGVNFGCQHATVLHTACQLGCTYAYILGTSGLAYRLLWNSTKWDLGNSDIIAMAEDPAEPFRRAFEAVGYGYELFLKSEHADRVAFSGERRDDEEYYRARIVQSIRDQGRPVIAFGVIGPPECCVVTGYDEGGDVLVGWNYFQEAAAFTAGVELESSGYFRKRDWFKDALGLIVIGEEREMPPLGEVFRKALKWALEVVRTPRIRDHHAGLVAYEAWAAALLRDDEFPVDDISTLRERQGVHNDAVGTVAEGRWYGAQFLKAVAGHEPAMARDLLAAAACYEAEHDLMWRVWGLEGGNGWSDEYARKLSEPEVRRQSVPIILQVRARDAEAAEHLEHALA